MAMEVGPCIPRRCPCGAATVVLTSKTKENPGRRFYRCGVVFGENHVFKWADDAVLEEIEALAVLDMAMEVGPCIPRRCPCGAATVVLTSKTKENPGRRFYRCGVVFGENHVFKWADDAVLEEIEALAVKQSVMENELIEIKEQLLDIKKILRRLFRWLRHFLPNFEINVSYV
ncbi:hypothetical protein DY000_02033633 [Brassica cretica]|uniref:GRF-type domain-containing protein n=2 Tax=Brassica cretica TaxID=69181 RepID=A0ABQ7DJ67_BRACR|nr:hypothetical protein DY000_02033633 [Brassica cretica]